MRSSLINPLGFAFENFDPVGRFRSSDNGLPVNAADIYQNNGFEAQFSNAHELAVQLGESDLAHQCYAEHWLSYLYGRLAHGSDDALLGGLAAKSKSQNLSAKAVIRALQVDGEGMGERTRVDFTSWPAALRVVAPSLQALA